MCPEVFLSEAAFSFLLRPQSIHRMALSSNVVGTLDVLQQKSSAPRFYLVTKLTRDKTVADMHSRLSLKLLEKLVLVLFSLELNKSDLREAEKAEVCPEGQRTGGLPCYGISLTVVHGSENRI